MVRFIDLECKISLFHRLALTFVIDLVLNNAKKLGSVWLGNQCSSVLISG